VSFHNPRERILFIKANIQYQYHKTITSGRLPEGITHQDANRAYPVKNTAKTVCTKMHSVQGALIS